VAPAHRPPPQPLVQPTQPPCGTGEPRGIVRLGFTPIVNDRSLVRFGPGAGRQIAGLVFDRTGQEPQVTFCRFSFTISLRGFHMISARYLRKWRGFLLCDFNFIMDFNRF